jgi:hypothetical protein
LLPKPSEAIAPLDSLLRTVKFPLVASEAEPKIILRKCITTLGGQSKMLDGLQRQAAAAEGT